MSVRGELTVSFVNNVAQPGKYGDKNGLGLALRVNKSGSKQFNQRLTFEGRRMELGLGSPPVVTLAAARDQALDNKRLVRSGQNPMQRKQKLRQIPSFKEAAFAACELHSLGKASKYKTRFMGNVSLHAFPHFGEKKINEVTSKDIFNALTEVLGKSADGGRKLRTNLGVIINWAISKDFVTEDPMPRATIGLVKPAPSKGHRKALAYSMVNKLVEELKASNASPATKLSLELLILTASRSGEIRNALWSEVDLQSRIWTIPAHRMKMRRDHLVPLSDRALEIMIEAKQLNPGSDLVFQSPRGKALSDMTLSKFVKKSLGYNVDVHGFRTSFRTWTQELTDCKEEVAELSLAHAIGNEVRRAYARSDLLLARQKVMQDWADYLKFPSDQHEPLPS